MVLKPVSSFNSHTSYMMVHTRKYIVYWNSLCSYVPVHILLKWHMGPCTIKYNLYSNAIWGFMRKWNYTEMAYGIMYKIVQFIRNGTCNCVP